MLLRFYTWATGVVMRLLGARRKTRLSGTTELVVNELGAADGEPWILLHGLGSTSLCWALTAARLKGRCRMLIPELSVLGGTRTPELGLDVRTGVEAVAELIRSRFPGRAVTVSGLSLGGWIGVRLALAYPELVERLLLVNCAGYRDQDWDRIEHLVRIKDPETLDRLMRALFYRAVWLRWIVRRGSRAAYRSMTVRSIVDSLRPEDSFDTGDLARLQMPVGLVWAQHDGLFFPEVGRAMAAALPRARLRMLDGCGHAIQWERPWALTASVERFRRDSTP